MTDPPWQTARGRGRGRHQNPAYSQYGGRTNPAYFHQRSTARSSAYSTSNSNFPVLQQGNKTLINSRISQDEASSSHIQTPNINLDDIPETHPLFQQIKSYLAEKGKTADSFASIVTENSENKLSYEKLEAREIIVYLENRHIPPTESSDEAWRILKDYLTANVYFAGESYKTRTYYEQILVNTASATFEHSPLGESTPGVHGYSKIIIKKLIPIEEWGISSMTLRNLPMGPQGQTIANFTYWDYIKAFSQVFYYNNYKHKHTWFVKICSKVFEKSVPNWFIHWWTQHGPSVKILPPEYFSLYTSWKKSSPFLTELYHSDHICKLDTIDQMYFYIEFSIPWIHKWSIEIGYDSQQIPAIYRTFYCNFWDKLLRIDPATKLPYGHDQREEIKQTIAAYAQHPKMSILIEDKSINYVSRRISAHDGNKLQMIEEYLAEVKNKLLLNIEQSSDTSMNSTEANTDDITDSQPPETLNEEEVLANAAEFLKWGQNTK